MGMPLWHVISQKRTATRLSFKRASIAGKAEPVARLNCWPLTWNGPLLAHLPWLRLIKARKNLDEVIDPFNARMAKPLVPTVRGIFADGDVVIILFDAAATTKDNKPYENTYTWYFQMQDAKVVKAIAFFDNRHFDEFWNRVSPKP